MRLKGQSTFVKIPLAKLNEVLANYPGVSIAVGKGNLAELEAALDVDFGVLEKKGATEATQPEVASNDSEEQPTALSGMSVD